MSDASANSPAAGWYPDPAGSPLQRWWDGAAWTERTYDPISAASAAPVHPDVPAGTRVSTPWIWIIALLPLLSLLGVLLVDYRQYMEDTFALQTDPGGFAGLPASFGQVLGLSALGWLVYALSVLFAFLDWRALKKRGVTAPFHWAWAFLFVIPYVIGRAVVLKRRGRSYFVPMWVYLAIYVITLVVSIVKVADAVSSVSDLILYG